MRSFRKHLNRLLFAAVLGCVAFTLTSCEANWVSEPSTGWRAISHLKPADQDAILKLAIDFGKLVEITDVVFPKIASSHTNFVEVTGVNSLGYTAVIGVDPNLLKGVKIVWICPRSQAEALEVAISVDYAREMAFSFMAGQGLSIRDGYSMDDPKVVEIGPWKRWRFVWRHQVSGVTVLPDFVLIEVNASEAANVTTYSEVHHDVSVGLDPVLTSEQAVDVAQTRFRWSDRLDLAQASLAVVYPNRYFETQGWQWSEEQALCWILEFEKGEGHTIDVWVDAHDGTIQGGRVCHSSLADLYSIDDPFYPYPDHMKSHLDDAWSPYMEMTKLETSRTSTLVATGINQTTIIDSIENEQYLIVAAHGDPTATGQEVHLASHTPTTDGHELIPTEIPRNDLRFAYLGVCYSGCSDTGPIFREVFVDQGADVFIGFCPAMCPMEYENRFLYHLAKGRHVTNAHSLAISEANLDYEVVITYNKKYMNRIRLAPLLVSIERAPGGDIPTGSEFKVKAIIKNGEDAHETAAENVTAKLVVPFGFEIASGANPQSLGTLDWYAEKSAQWTLIAPGDPREYTFDVEVWSDNLGVSVHDPDDEFHKFDINVS